MKFVIENYSNNTLYGNSKKHTKRRGKRKENRQSPKFAFFYVSGYNENKIQDTRCKMWGASVNIPMQSRHYTSGINLIFNLITMFKVRRVWSSSISIRNIILLFFTIVLWFASVITLANITIPSVINNAWQTIGRVTVTSDWTESGTKYLDVNYAGNWKTYINTAALLSQTNFTWKVLGVDEAWELVYVYANNLIVSWVIITGTTISWSDDDWTIVGNNIYRYTGNVGIGTTNPTKKFHIVNAGSTDVYIEETIPWMAANLNLQNPERTRAVGGDSSPDVFYVWLAAWAIFFAIDPLGNIGIWTTTPQERLEISGGNLRINDLKNKVVLGTDGNGTIIGSTSGNVYNFISGYILSWARWATGATGAQGNQGIPWPQWIPWIQGIQGATGATGQQGNQWIQGITWATGATGAKGDKGDTWDTGPIGATGATGATGPQGIQGEVWPQWPAWVGEWTGDNLGNHIALQDIKMQWFWIAYNSYTPGLLVLSDGRILVDSTIQIGNLSWLTCNTTNSGTIKYIPNCFQWCDWTNRITLWWTCIGLPAVCWDSTVTAPEVCDDGNTTSNDWCSATCARETPICNFSFTPTTGPIPLQVTFQWTEQNRAMYKLNFGNGLSTNNQSYFSWTTHIYQSIGNFTPTLVARNQGNVSTQTTCYASGWTTGITTNPACGNGILEGTEVCDDGNESANDWCNATCTARETPPACSFTMSPTSGSIPLSVRFTWAETSRVVYTLNFDNGSSLYDQPHFSWVTTIYTIAWAYHPTLVAKNTYNRSTTTTCSGSVSTINVNPTPKYCGDGIVQAPNDAAIMEECDDGNMLGNDSCTAGCKRNIPTCNFTFTPPSWDIPFSVTFQWVSTGWAVYTLYFGNGNGAYNLASFSWQTATYTSIGNFIPTLIAQNRDHLSTQRACYASWETTITANPHCWDGNTEGNEQCDDNNTGNNDWCTSTCQREMPPACNFSMSPKTGYIPLTVTFTWIETSRVVYELNFDNGSWIYDQPHFSGETTTYTIAWEYHPTLIAKNKYNLATNTGCSVVWTSTINITTPPKYCGDGIVQTPNNSWNYEQCDLWSWANSSTWMCGTGCTYNTPECSIFASPSVLIGTGEKSTLTWTLSYRASYIITTILPDGTQAIDQYPELKLNTGFEITNIEYKELGEYTIKLSSSDGQGVSCFTNIKVYENGEYACGDRHKSDQTTVNMYDLKLCAPGYKAVNLIGNSWTIVDVWAGKWKKKAIIIPESVFESFATQFTYIDTGKNLVLFSWWYYIRFLRTVLNTGINILLPQQWSGYRTRDCVDINDEKTPPTTISSCYAHKKLNGDCAYDMNIDGGIRSRYFTSWQIHEAMDNSWWLFKCALVDNGNGGFEIPQYKFSRWLPTQWGHGNAACQVIPVWPQTEQNLYYLHRTCPWYNYGTPSQSCDSILLSWQWITSCAWLLEELYTSWWTWWFNTKN